MKVFAAIAPHRAQREGRYSKDCFWLQRSALARIRPDCARAHDALAMCVQAESSLACAEAVRDILPPASRCSKQPDSPLRTHVSTCSPRPPARVTARPGADHTAAAAACLRGPSCGGICAACLAPRPMARHGGPHIRCLAGCAPSLVGNSAPGDAQKVPTMRRAPSDAPRCPSREASR